MSIPSNKSHCSLHDGSIFLGISSLPVGKDSEFIAALSKMTYDIKLALEKKVKMREEKKELNPYINDLSQDFYIPHYFYLFGQFDLLFLTMVEGFNFPIRQFSYLAFQKARTRKKQTLQFARHSVLGPTPKFDPEKRVNKVLGHLFHENSNAFPLITICRLKVNDFHLFDSGVEFLRGCIKVINHILKTKRDSRGSKSDKSWMHSSPMTW